MIPANGICRLKVSFKFDVGMYKLIIFNYNIDRNGLFNLAKKLIS